MMETICFHIPHASLYIPADYRRTSLIDAPALQKENRLLCDLGVEQLLPTKLRKKAAVCFPYSRLYCDVERLDDAHEPMSARGMGVVYTHTMRGVHMFAPDDTHRVEIQKLYDRHHAMLCARVRARLREKGRCTLIDLHSFADEAVEVMFGCTDTPDICLGTDAMYTPTPLVMHFYNAFTKHGYRVQWNRPYQGVLVPARYLHRAEPRLQAIMLEINRRVYRPAPKAFKTALMQALRTLP